jgi:hypothetical protein
LVYIYFPFWSVVPRKICQPLWKIVSSTF